MRIEWGGWESTTTRLQQMGWEISAEQDIRFMGVRLALRHQDFKMYGLTSMLDLGVWEDLHRFEVDAALFRVQYMASRMHVQIREDLTRFKPIDAMPQMVEIKEIEDFKIFAAPLARTEEIIVDPDEVDRLLELIKEAQGPKQADIRKRDYEHVEADARPRQKFHAQILSVA